METLGMNIKTSHTFQLKKTIRILLIVLVILLLFAGISLLIYQLALNPYRGAVDEFAVSKDLDYVLTEKEAKEDLDYVIDKLRNRHPAWLEEENAKVDEVEKRYSELSGRIGEVTMLQFYRDISYLLNPLHDGHTYIDYNDPDLRLIDDVSYLRQGIRPTHINGEPIEDIINCYLQYESYEVEADEREAFFDNAVCYSYFLRKCGVDTFDGVTFTYVIDGHPTDIHHKMVNYDTWCDMNQNDQEESGDGSELTVERDCWWVYYNIDVKANLGVFTLQECICDTQYRKTVDDFFKVIAENHITNVVIDLRDNGGGNSSVVNYFIRYLDIDRYCNLPVDVRYGDFLLKFRNTIANKRLQPQFTGQVYVLTNRRTFSAAKDFAMMIRDNDLGLIVGRASSNLPDTYGDSLFFVLPNSHMNLSVSYKRWFRIDSSKAGQPLTPDVECDSYQALDKVYELIK